MKESEIQALIVYALRFKGYLAIHHQQNTSFGSFEQGRKIHDSYAMNAHLKKIGYIEGVPDLLVIGTESNGNRIRLYIECKSETGVLSANQKHMIRMLEVSGEEVRVVRNLNQIQDLLDKDIIRLEKLLLDKDIEDARIKKENEILKAQEKIQKKESQKLERLKKKELKQLAKEQEKLEKQLLKAEKKSKSKKIQKK